MDRLVRQKGDYGTTERDYREGLQRQRETIETGEPGVLERQGSLGY